VIASATSYVISHAALSSQFHPLWCHPEAFAAVRRRGSANQKESEQLFEFNTSNGQEQTEGNFQ
jgi:hypothetical protein